ncbi:hypothetical protein [Stutzerimonas nitrititolerans]|uniref:hypothetical protein n=1 Tax=Stutzerimonas nitrititolerans TaxID=2482751 RepID=UPI003AA7EC6A
MRVMVFPAAFMANTFAMMMVMIGLSLFGKPGMAADFGLVHGATVALFYSFSGNARSLILGESGGIDAAAILRLRLVLLLPLTVLAFVLCIGVVDSGWLFILLLVVRRAAEWLAEVFLSEQEIRHRGAAALRFTLVQGAFSVALLLALLGDGTLALPMTLVWALSPLLGCVSRALLGHALKSSVPVVAGIRLMLPHFGSTAAIGVSVYVFRVFILLMAGKDVAGDLFSAFALGGILGAVFSQALGPTMVRQEQSATGQGRLSKIFNLMLGLVAAVGGTLILSIWSVPHLLDWTQKSQLFWLAVGCSLVGGVVMVLAQLIRLRILQDKRGGDVFGSDMLANILLVACVPFFFFLLGAKALALLYLVGACLSYLFYASERDGLLGTAPLASLSEPTVLLALALSVMAPVFFQLSGGLFTSKDIVFLSEGVLSRLPLPLSIAACYLGIVLLGRYSQIRRSLLGLFFLFLGMLFSSLVVGQPSGDRLVLLMQYLLPVAALVFGEQFGQREQALTQLARAAHWVLWLVVPLQLFSSWQLGYGYLSPSLYVFSIYQHLQYVPVIFVGLFWLVVFEKSVYRSLGIGLWILAFLMGIYIVKSQSLVAIGFMALAGLGFAIRNFRLGVPRVLGFLFCLMLGAGLGVQGMVDKPPFVQKFSTGQQQENTSENVAEVSLSQQENALRNVVPQNVVERIDYWKFYVSKIFDGGSEAFFGHGEIIDRDQYPSAHNYYLDILYNFGLVGLAPLLGLIAYTFMRVLGSFSMFWKRSDLLGLLGVAAFLVLIDNSLKVGLRQPYSGILVFFFWGVLLAHVVGRSAPDLDFSDRVN